MRNLRDGRKFAVIWFAASIAPLTGLIFIPSIIVQFASAAAFVLFASVGVVEWVDFRRRVALELAERRQTIQLTTQKMLDEQTTTKLFQAVKDCLILYKSLTPDQRRDWGWQFPILFDLYDLDYREHAYTIRQAQMVLFEEGNLTKRYGRYYLPVIHAQDSTTRIWLTALTDDLIAADCAKRDNPRETAYLIVEPEQAFLKLYKGDDEDD